MPNEADAALTPEDRAFVEELRTWLAEHLKGDFKKIGAVGGPADDAEWEVRRQWEMELAAGKWLNVAWPVKYGGRGGTPKQELLFHIEHANAGAPYWVGVQGRDLFGPTLMEYGTQEQKDYFLPRIAAVQDLWGQGFSEPNAGSDIASLSTKAELDGDEWVITGQKVWTTFGAYADWLYVLCRTEPGSQRHKGISMLLIPADQPGVEIRAIRNIADRTEFAEVFLDGARTKKENVVGEVNGGWSVVMGTLGNERAGATVLPFQAGFKREMVALIELVKKQGRNNDPVLRNKLMEAWSGLKIMELNNDRLLTTVLAGHHPGPESSIGKLFWANWHRSFGELMVDVMGADAIASETNVLHHPMVHSFLNSRAETIYGGANEVQRNIVGERVLGLPK